MAHFFSMDEFMHKLEQAWMLGEAFLETHDESLLEIEIAAWKEILSTSAFKQLPPDFQTLNYGRAGQSFFNRYHARKRLEDLSIARQLFNEDLQHSTDISLRSTLLHSLGDVFTNLYRDRGILEDLEQSIAYYRKALALLGLDDDNWCAYMDDLGTALRDHYTHTGSLPPLEESIRVHQQTLKNATASSPGLATYFTHLGNALLDRYKHMEQLDDLQRAVVAFEQAMERTSLEDRPGHLSNLGNALSYRGKHLHAIADLERAVELQREAVKLDPQHLFYRTNLGCELGLYYAETGRPDAIDESIIILEKVIEDAPPNSPDLPDYHVNLCTSLLNRYDNRTQPGDLQRALRHYNIALALISDASEYDRDEGKPLLLDASVRPNYLYYLAGALLVSYQSTGRVADLYEAIERQREALRLLPATAISSQAEYRRGLSNLLLHRYERERKLDLLDEAVELAEYGPHYLDSGSPHLSRMYDALGNALRRRYMVTHMDADIQKAIASYRKALALLAADSPDVSVTRNNLGNALRDSYAASYNVPELEAAIEHIRQLSLPGLADFLREPTFPRIAAAAAPAHPLA